MAERNYAKEYRDYHGKPDQVKRRASRNAARRKLAKERRVKNGDGKDIDHKDGNPLNNSPSNLRVMDRSANRSKKALLDAYELLPVAKALIDLRQLSPLTELRALVEQAGARHSMTDNEMIQHAHDLLVQLGAFCGGARCQRLTRPATPP